MSTKKQNKNNAVENNDLAAGLEIATATVKNETTEATAVEIPKYGDRAFLEANYPTAEDFAAHCSSKYKEDREPKVKQGLEMAIQLGININPLTLLLAKWWEVKPARNAIKKMIDDEAKTKGIPDVIYMQDNLRKEIDAFAEMFQASERLKYTITYFKPREKERLSADFEKDVLIEGTTYVISAKKLATIVAEFTDKDERRSEIIANSRLKEVDVY